MTQQHIPRILPLHDGSYDEAPGQLGGDVLEAVDRDIDLLVQ